ncbi:cohesin loading factor-domain-containing protein [Protomyces lactucae-debilis]|uniref:Cohesin loading factor-domain-containing protein n=1 Tax=Protomyces lactucae-debilis TaxID=2754530 RepID=A0A1Y2FQ48_PROLT|nr:cohesin loading factor-domain-containing protein [Protomyces lactucae-debilis]ORY85454.1 cohesin loading factor-domain-containing protein [Protomyces lactucae-debilis]
MSCPAVAEELIALADSLPADEARAPALLAVSILENHLYTRREQPLPPSLLFSLELRIAQVLFRHTGEVATVESMLGSLSNKLGNYEEFVLLRIEVNALLAQLMQQAGQSRAAVKVLEHSASLAAERHLTHLQYTALLQIHQITRNAAILRTLASMALQNGHSDFARYVRVLTQLDRAQHGLPTDTSAFVAPSQGQAFTLLDLVSLMTQITTDMTMGECATALPRLSSLHAQLDSKPWPASQTIIVGPNQSLTLSWLSKPQGFALVSLLSAHVHLADMTSHRAARFLQDGLQQLPHIRDPSWRDQMQVAIWTTQVIDAIVRQQFVQADALLIQIGQGSRITPLHQYLHASLLQAQGRLQEALGTFLSLAQGVQLPGPRPAADTAVSVMSGLSAVLILRSNVVPALYNPSEATLLLNSLRPHCTASPLQACLGLVTAADPSHQREQPLDVRKILTSLMSQAARLCSTDLKCLALTLLASPQRNQTDPPAAKRQFAQAAYSLASRPAGELSRWSLWHGLGWARILEEGGALEHAAQQHAMNERIRGALLQQGQLALTPWL